jgi:hypothetical protein
MSRPPILSLVLLAGLLTACANTTDAARREQGVLQLREPLRIEPDAATARLQYGALVARNAVQEQDPFCVFEIDTVRPEIQTVAPATFHIVGISHSVETIAGMPVLPFTWQIRRVSFGDNDSPSHIYYKTTFRLSDTQQPVRALTCMSNQAAPGNANSMRHLTLAEIRGALGALFALY